MEKQVIINKSQVRNLIRFVEKKTVRKCDHSLKWTLEWANNNKINQDDITDAFAEIGGYCDCEVTLNLLDDEDLILTKTEIPIDEINPFKIPLNYKLAKDKLYTKALFAIHDPKDKCYAMDGELLFPPPYGAKAKKRVSKFFHFYNGISSELPCESGYVKSIDAISAKDFAKKLRDTKLESFKRVKERDADFYLSSLEKIELDKMLIADFLNVLRNYKRQIELKIYVYGK